MSTVQPNSLFKIEAKTSGKCHEHYHNCQLFQLGLLYTVLYGSLETTHINW